MKALRTTAGNGTTGRHHAGRGFAARPQQAGRGFAARLLAAVLVLALTTPTVFDALYQCGDTGRLLAAPCPKDARQAAPETAGFPAEAAGGCCSDEASPGRTSCCERIDIDSLPLLAVKPELPAPDGALCALDDCGPGASAPAIRVAALQGPGPPGAPPPLYLLHSRFLC